MDCEVELTPRKDVLFIIGEWNTKVGNEPEKTFLESRHTNG